MFLALKLFGYVVFLYFYCFLIYVFSFKLFSCAVMYLFLFFIFKHSPVKLTGKQALGEEKLGLIVATKIQEKEYKFKDFYGQPNPKKQNISRSLDKICESIFYCFSA
jgi:hypothetical protein